MHSKNKRKMDATERLHVDLVKSKNCVICGKGPGSEAHEIKQGAWFLSVSLCADCHRGSKNGIHGEKVAWRVAKMSELDALNETLRRVYGGTERHSAPKVAKAKERAGNNLSSSKILPRAA